MKGRFFKTSGACVLALAALTSVLAAVPLAAAPAPAAGAPPSAIPFDHVPGEVLVKFEPGTSPGEQARLHAEIGAEVLAELPALGVVRLRAARGQSAAALIRAYAHRPGVAYAEPNGLFRTLLTPQDQRFSDLWGMHNTGQTGGTPDADIDGPEAWDLETGDPAVVVADIDTGVDYNHEDLAANMWVNSGEIAANGIDDDGNGLIDDVRGWDFANGDNDPFDGHSHGTHTSGTLGAVGDNHKGVTGVAWQVKIMPLKFLADSGSGTFADAAEAILYAAQMGARISSNSWGCGPNPACFSQTVDDAIAVANEHDMLFVVAAGNTASNNDTSTFYPCNSEQPNVLCVAATDHDDAKAGFSNYGATKVDLGAPGVSILSTVPGDGYAYLNGTSMATPHVAGAAALVLSYFGDVSTEEIKDILMSSVDPVASLAGKTVTGGRLNAYGALNTAYSVSVAPRTQTVLLGSSVPYTVTVRSLNGFSAPVSLSFTSPDPEITGSFDPVTVTPPSLGTATSTLTVSTTEALAPGAYVLTIDASDGQGEDHTATAVLTGSGPDFEIDLDPTSKTVATGGSTDYDVTVSSVASYSGTVTLSLTADPDISGSFSPNPVTVPVDGSAVSTMTVTTDPAITGGTYTLTVEGTDGVKTRTGSAFLDVTRDVDLIVTSVSGDTEASLGTYIDATVQVKNQGTESSGRYYRLGLYICESSAGTGWCTLIKESFVAETAAGETKTVNFTNAWVPNNKPYAMIPGRYVLLGHADDLRDIDETDETNNTLGNHDIDIYGPDVVMTAVTGPATAVKGASIDVANTLTNQGPGRTPEWPNNEFDVGLYLSADTTVTTEDHYLGTRTLSDLLAGASDAAVTPVTIPASVPSGTYYLSAIADDGDAIYEEDELNNGFADGVIQIDPPTTLSDLVMTEVDGPRNAKLGSLISVDDTVANQGAEGTGVGFQVSLYLSTDAVIDTSDILLHTRQVGALAAGASNSATYNVYLSTQLTPGTYYLGGIADSGDWVSESNEGNNALWEATIKLR